MAADVTADFGDSLRGLCVCVAGLGVSGPPAARVLASLGAVVTAVDSRDDTERQKIASELIDLGIEVRLGSDAAELPSGTGLVVTSPGWQPDAPLLVAAAAAGIDVLGDVELAWRLRPELPGGGGRQRWLAVTGTNGKTTTVRMLALMLEAAGYRGIAAGNVGTSLVEVVTEPEPHEVVAVELSSFQLYWSSTIAARAAALLNVAAHHLDWHGTFEAYADAKAKIFVPGATAIGNLDDEWSARLTARAPGAGRVVMFSLREPSPGELGVAGGVLVDREFGPEGELVELAAVDDLDWTYPEGDRPLETEGPQALTANFYPTKKKKRKSAPHNISDALAAAALARSYGAPPEAVRAGLAAFRPDPHRITLVATVGGVDYVDDSKATNPHAAAASLAAYQPVVWVAGGLLKGADDDLDRLVAASAPRLRGVVLLGADRAKIAAALGRHAPDVPVTEVTGPDTGIMELVVRAAAKLAEPGDTVLLAPAAQSFDMFRDYPARGDAFADAVRRLAARK